MYNIVPLVLILLSLSVIIIIAAKKFSVLANLDIENIPTEKEAKFKEKLISDRLKRNFTKWRFRIIKLLKPLSVVSHNFFKWAYSSLHELKDKYKREALVSAEDLSRKIEQLFSAADDFRRKGELEKAEKILIEIIGLDNKNIKAFKELGQI